MVPVLNFISAFDHEFTRFQHSIQGIDIFSVCPQAYKVLILNIEINQRMEINLIPSARHENITEMEEINSGSIHGPIIFQQFIHASSQDRIRTYLHITVQLIRPSSLGSSRNLESNKQFIG